MAEAPHDLYNQILQNGPSSGTVLLVLSVMKKEGHFKKVIQECIKALDVYPYDVQIRHLLAETYFEAGLISQAEAELQEVTTRIGDLSSAYRLQAEIFSRQKREQEAAEALNLYLAHRPDDQEALDLLQTLKPVEDTPVPLSPPTAEKTAGSLEEVMGEVPERPGEQELPEIATPTLAEIYFNQGQLQEAINTYEKIVTQDQEDERSRGRLDELRRMMVSDRDLGDEDVEKARQKKEKMISILEAWLDSIQEMSKTSISA
jgi:tetratricopeptide (TPR) repeat protein